MEEFFYIFQKVKNSRINLEKDEEYLLMMPELFKKVCRLCLSEADNLQPISAVHQNKPKYSSLILNLMGINLESHDDEFHSMICEECASNLTLFFKFREKIETNNETLTRLKSMIDQIKHPMKVEEDKQFTVHIQEECDEEEIEVLTTVQEDYTPSVAGESVDVAHMKAEPIVEAVEEMEELEEEVGESEFLDPSWCDDASNTKIEVVKATDVRCLVCNRTFDHIDRLERHMTKRHSHEVEDLYVDPNEEVTSQADTDIYEDVEMISEQGLDKIQKQTSMDPPDEPKPPRIRSKRPLNHHCLICRHPFDGPKKLARHMTIHEEGYKGRKYNNIIELEPVIDEDEEIVLDPFDSRYIVREIRNKKYNCPICDLAIDTPSKLKKHLETHAKTEEEAEANTFVCQVCFCAFSTEEYLDKHEKQHDNKSRQYPRHPLNFESPRRRLLCELCGRNFQNRSSFMLHLPQHTGQKPFKCGLCDTRFTRKHHVKIHMRTHDDYKPFGCEICGMAFTKSGNLNRHLAVHSSDRNYHCEICGKAFKRKNDLPKHMITHTGERNFKCKTCNKTYTSRSGLVKHWKHHPQQNAGTGSTTAGVATQITEEIPVFEAREDEGGQLTILSK